MAKITIEDDCLAPEKYIYLTYSGPDPWGVVKKISGMIKPFFHVSTSALYHDRLNWDVSGDPVGFFSLWRSKKSMSAFSTAWFNIWVQGTKTKTDNTGQFTLRLDGTLKSEFRGLGIIVKPFWVMYSYLFYNRVRRRFIERCSDLLLNFRNEIKEHYNLRMTTIPGSQVSFGE